jgi:hypothetical protein
MDPAADTSPSSRLLIEDQHQGSTSAAAQRTIERYRQFVQRQRAPIAQMNYSPFGKGTATQAQPAHQGNRSSINQHFESQWAMEQT